MPTNKAKPEPTAVLSGPENTASAAPAEESRLEPGATPRVGFSNAGKIARFALQRAGEKKLTQVASSLTFTTVLAIVPLLAVVLALFTAFPLFAEFRVALENFLTSSLMPPSVSENVMLYLNQFAARSEEHTSELQSLVRISYAV